VAQAVARGMMQRRYGASSTLALLPLVRDTPGLAPYGASRGGIQQLTMSLATTGAAAASPSTVSPGWFQTQQNKVL